jgi:hypothetical protein
MISCGTDEKSNEIPYIEPVAQDEVDPSHIFGPGTIPNPTLNYCRKPKEICTTRPNY